MICHLSELIELVRTCSVFIQIAFLVVVEKGNDFPLFPKRFPHKGKIFLWFVKKQLGMDH
jgi:hypothetical protein